jgi:cytochrome c oxidase subunit 2
MWDFPLFPERASTAAGLVDLAYFVAIGVLTFFTLLILFLILFLSFWYRRGRVVDRSNPPEANSRMEVLWIGGPLVLGIGMFVLGAEVYFELYEAPGTRRARRRSTSCTCPWGGR